MSKKVPVDPLPDHIPMEELATRIEEAKKTPVKSRVTLVSELYFSMVNGPSFSSERTAVDELVDGEEEPWRRTQTITNPISLDTGFVKDAGWFCLSNVSPWNIRSGSAKPVLVAFDLFEIPPGFSLKAKLLPGQTISVRAQDETIPVKIQLMAVNR